MNLREFQSAATAVLVREPQTQELRQVSGMASDLAEMVGWAPGIIDTRGEVRAVLERIRSSASQMYAAKGMQEVAIFHDAVAALMDAIAGHDRDLEPSGPGDDDHVENC